MKPKITTPGEWKAGRIRVAKPPVFNNQMLCIGPLRNDGEMNAVAIVTDPSTGDLTKEVMAEVAANAHLLSASKELREACEAALFLLDGEGADAVSKGTMTPAKYLNRGQEACALLRAALAKAEGS